MNHKGGHIQRVQRRGTIANDIAAQLQRLILDGTYPPGRTLPSQRELARQFGASVPSVREAISVLSASGMLETRTGHGTTVRTLAHATAGFDGWLGLVDSDDELQELIQARQLLEHFTVHAAARNMMPGDAARLQGILDDMQAALSDPERYLELDLLFHMTVADIAGNRVISRLMRIIQAPLRRQLQRNIDHLHSTGRLGVSLADHEQLLGALCDGKPEQAFAHIDRMLHRAAVYGGLRASAPVAGEDD